MQHVARAIREEAHVRGWNTSELARRAGLTQTTARHFFYAEDRDAKVEALAAVAAAFDLSVSELILRAERAMTAAERIEAGVADAFDRVEVMDIPEAEKLRLRELLGELTDNGVIAAGTRGGDGHAES